MASKSNLNLAVEKLKDAGVPHEVWRGGRHWRIRWKQADGVPKTITVSSNPWAQHDVLRELRKLSDTHQKVVEKLSVDIKHHQRGERRIGDMRHPQKVEKHVVYISIHH